MPAACFSSHDPSLALLQALCPLRDVPPQSNHGDPLSYYQAGDLIRGK